MAQSIEGLGPAASGVFIAPADVVPLAAAARAAGCAWIEIDLSDAQDKAGILAACARGLAVPTPFGGNWDALADSLGDLGWRPAPGYVLSLRGADRVARHAPADLALFAEILQAAAAEWRGRGRVFTALVDAPLAGLHPFADRGVD